MGIAVFNATITGGKEYIEKLYQFQKNLTTTQHGYKVREGIRMLVSVLSGGLQNWTALGEEKTQIMIAIDYYLVKN